MSALLDQFIEEAGDLLEAAGTALLVLERNPGDQRAINDLFRSVHTFKGTSALFDYPALTKLVHTGEDLLDGVREGTIAVSAELVDLQLEMLDLLRAWVEVIRRSGALPEDAATASRGLIARLAATKSAGLPSAQTSVSEAADAASGSALDWLDRLDDEDRRAAFRTAVDEHVTVLAIAYEPDRDSYFRGEDPLQTAHAIPDLAALAIESVGPEPAIADFDPYQCRLRILALSTAPRSELEHVFRYVADQVRIDAVPADDLARGPASGGTANGLPLGVAANEAAQRIIDEQRAILRLPAGDGVIRGGRIASVGRTLSNIARAHGALAAVREIDEATALALSTADAHPLWRAIDRCFAGGRNLTVGSLAAPDTAAPAQRGETFDGRDLRQTPMLKVDQAKVDRLMALIGELVVAKNALPFLARRAEQVHGSREMSREIGQRYSVIDRLAQEMQGAIMEVRLLPVSEVFARFPRLIRDICRKLDKQIELVLEGEQTQADKNIIELLGDPLIHIVRNAADHGIEAPHARVAKGKPAQGTIRLRAMQEGDSVVIEITDDGRGVDTQRVIAKALERGIITPDQAEHLGPGEAAALIFHPGLSTADQVSDLSGRGVGMDVVQTSIREAGGSVSVSSQPDVGTTVRLALPLSMAVMRIMTIETAGALYGVPIGIIAETVRIETTAIRRIKQSEAFLLRDTIVPLVRLRSLLRLPARENEHEAVLVLRTAAGLVGMIVDGFDEHMDIILKPLEGILVGLRGFAGTALLGDGRVLMVLDVKEFV